MKRLLILLIFLVTTLTNAQWGWSWWMDDKSYNGTYDVPANKVMVIGSYANVMTDKDGISKPHDCHVLRAFIKGYQSTGGVWTGDTMVYNGTVANALTYAKNNNINVVIRSYTNAASDTALALANYPDIQYFATISNTKVQAFNTHISLPALIIPGTDSLGFGNRTAWNVEFLAPDSISANNQNRASSFANGYLAGQLCYIAHRLGVSMWTARYLARITGTAYDVREGYGLIDINKCISAYNQYVNYDALDPYKHFPNTPTIATAKYGTTGITVTLTSPPGDDSTRLYRSTNGSNYSWIKSLALNQNYVDTPLVDGLYYYKARNIKRMSLGGTSNISSIYVGVDTIPSAFAFTDMTECELSTEYVSDSIVVTGLDSAWAYAAGDYFRKGKYGSWVNVYTKVFNGDTIWVKNTSSESYSTDINTVLTIGGVSDIWVITTKAANKIIFSSNPMSEVELNNILAPTVITDYRLDGNIVTFSNTNYDIGAEAFSNITTITSIALSCTTVSERAFKDMTALTSISLPTATMVSHEAMAGCTALTTISLPSCTNLGGDGWNNEVFWGIEGQEIYLTIPSALETGFEGIAPDLDLSALRAANTVYTTYSN